MVSRIELRTFPEPFADAIELRVVPPLCLLPATPYDFSNVGEMIERAKEATLKWLNQGGLEKMVIPAQMRP